MSVCLSALNKYFRPIFLIIDFYFPWTEHLCELFSLDHPDLSSLDERLDYLFTKIFDAKARLTEISVDDMIGLQNISMTTILKTAEMSSSMSFITFF